jgi:23S rRNA (guanosine2251-2'-O)-methyltransferase
MAEGRTVHKKAGVRHIYKDYVRDHQPTIDLAFMLQDWDDPYNVGGMFRVADACGASELIMTGHTPVPPDPQVHVTSMGHHRRIAWQKIDKHEEAAVAIKEAGYQLVTIEIAEGAAPYDEFVYPERVCLVLGNETNGVYSSVMRHRDAAVFIPMFGKGRSMNVHVAAAIVAFEAIRQRKS